VQVEEFDFNAEFSSKQWINYMLYLALIFLGLGEIIRYATRSVAEK